MLYNPQGLDIVTCVLINSITKITEINIMSKGKSAPKKEAKKPKTAKKK